MQPLRRLLRRCAANKVITGQPLQRAVALCVAVATELSDTTVAEAGVTAGEAAGVKQDELVGDGSHSTEQYPALTMCVVF
jgi:hypothetical protein